MKRPLLLITCFLGAAQLCFSQLPQQSKPAAAQLGFEENKGQLADQNGKPLPAVLFKSTGTGPGIYITTSGLTYVFEKHNSSISAKEDAAPVASTDWSKVEMHLANASIKKENITCEKALPGYSNFYYAHCPQGILDVKTWQHITIKNIYPGIDWVFNADSKAGLSHDFIVHPGADPSRIKMTYKGMNLKKLDINAQKRLALVSAYGTMYEGGLHVYEMETGRVINADFDILMNLPDFCKNGRKDFVPSMVVGYELGDFSREKTLVIDPPLQWSMPQTSSGNDYGYAISAAHDGSGDVLVAGVTDGTNFPVSNAYQGTLSANEDMFVQRLNTSGARLWSTYYGGSDYDQAKSVASDAAGNCYVAGNTGSNDFPVLNPIQANYGNGVYDAAILKFNTAGVRQFASWYGSFGTDQGTAITADAAGNMYVTGYTNSANWVTLNPIQATKNIGYDAFIMKLDASCVLQWATYYGGDDDDKARAITVDATGANIYITGTTLAGGFPVTAGVFQNSSASAYNAEEAFILKMSSTQVVAFASYCGGSDGDFGQGIAVDNAGNIFITGYTLSSNFPIVNPGNGAYVDSTIGSIGTHDAFVVKCNPTGTTRLWSTYFGGTSPDLAFGIAYDATAGIYISGHTSSLDFPLQQPADSNYYQFIHGDAGSFNDMFFAWFNSNDSLKWSTYYGDLSSNECYGICVDANHNIFAAGVSNNDADVLKFGPGFTTGITGGPYYQHISIYPNPAQETLTLHFSSDDGGTFRFEILNIHGQIISTTEKTIASGNSNTTSFDLQELAHGVYFLKVIYPSGSSEILKFVRE